MPINKEHLIKLTEALYKVTGLLPEQEPLRKSIRQEGLNILALGATFFSNPCLIFKDVQKRDQTRIILGEQMLESIAGISAFFGLAKKQNWLDGINFVILNNAYQDLKREINEIISANISNSNNRQGAQQKEQSTPLEQKPAEEPSKQARVDLAILKNKRHKKIMAVLEKKDKAQVKDLEPYFPQTSKRTLRRDMGYLVDYGFLKRIGNRNDTFYQIIR